MKRLQHLQMKLLGEESKSAPVEPRSPIVPGLVGSEDIDLDQTHWLQGIAVINSPVSSRTLKDQ